MKKEQFKHNLEKSKRQGKFERESIHTIDITKELNNWFEQLGELYKTNKQ